MDLKVKVYDNGATLLYRKRKRKHTSVAAGFLFGNNRKKYPEPTAHFCEHLFFHETKNRSEKQIVEQMKTVFSMKNARTSPYRTYIEFCRSNKIIEGCFELASDMLLNSKFPAKIVESEKGVIKQELNRRLNNPQVLHSYASYRSLSTEFPQNNSRNLGSEEEIDAITPKILKKFRDEVFVSQNFIIAIEGGISYFKAKRLAKKYFINNLKSNPDYPVDKTTGIVYDRSGNLNVEYFPFSKSKCSLIFKLDEDMENDKNYQILSMLSQLSNGLGGKLFMKLRNNGLVYNATLTFSSLKKHSLVEIIFDCVTENVNKCIDKIGEVLRDFRQNKFEESQIQNVIQNRKIGEDEATPACIFPPKLFNLYIDYGKEIFSKKRKRETKKIFEKLTAEDVQEFCKTVFSKPENLHVSILTGDKNAQFYSYAQMQEILCSDKKRRKKRSK